ncbi:MAG: cobyric acid synthase [Candidatus Methanoplasma sp.]|jgi:adenosylcobyric acid synthase|nr:cobyric acid synthase [Candidatus Methanoplasma sp.]
MENITKKVREEIGRGWIGPDLGCPYHPCHFIGQDCTFCFCPFYPCNDADLGDNITGRGGNKIWQCTYCLLIHRPEVGKYVMSEIERLGIQDPKDPRMRCIFDDVKERFHRNGRALMVLGATSDAGKSVTVAAICRILHNKGYLVAPFKSQNMSLNSKVTPIGSEIAMIQTIQASAAGLKNPDHHMNPILLKPKGDTRSQVMVEGEPFGDYDVSEYYDEFVPGPGTEAVKRNIEFLKQRYDFVVMEGAGSPAEINIYDRDIANMGAAVIADADCILVVNVKWGGSFAYAVGTVKLIPEKDRERIKGIVLNNVLGNPSNLKPGAEELEKILGIPVIGIIPHADVVLPSEDSEAFRGISSRGNGGVRISVIKIPRIANFTDLDPLYMEDTTVKFVTRPEELEGSDAIIIPGTKNTIDDLLWMRGNGLDKAICSFRGTIPILGICGGYQMMGRSLKDPHGIEGKIPQTVEGLGLFDMSTEWDEYRKKVIRDQGILLETGEPVTGYEIHMGLSEVNEAPLFRIDRFRESENEGAFRKDDMLFGTYLHGVFDKPAFRRFFLSFVKKGGEPLKMAESGDYDDLIEENIKKLAAVFEEGLDIDMLMSIAEGRS